MDTPAQSGPLTRAQLLELWESAVDPLYSQPLLDRGDGFGIEAFDQGHAQLARVSLGVDRTFQSLFIYPWSGQTDQPASGESRARATITFTRSPATKQRVLVLSPARTVVEEQQTDWGTLPGEAGQLVLTGRRYVLAAAVTFFPGDVGPHDELAVAELPGRGYDNPMPGSISVVAQAGSGFSNDGAAVRTTVAGDYLDAANRPDVVVPEHVGQYVEILTGPNVGLVRQAVGYAPPDLSATPQTGGTLQLRRLLVVEGILMGTPEPGEEFVQAATGARGTHAASTAGPPGYLALDVEAGTFAVGALVFAAGSGASFMPTAIVQPQQLAADPSCAWRVLDWSVDLGLEATNAASPAGGRTGTLDGLGAERAVYRAPGEEDEGYRERVGQIADVVSPAAVVRGANRVLAAYQVTPVLREAGQLLLPGVYYDQDAWDLDEQHFIGGPVTGQFQEGEVVTQLDPTTGVVARGRASLQSILPAGPLPAPSPAPPVIQGAVATTGRFKPGLVVRGARSGATLVPGGITGGLRPADRYRWWFDYVEMRAFFLIGLPTMSLGEFGFAYDAGPFGFYDSAPWLSFHDGFPATAAALRLAVWAAEEKARAGGVGWDITREDAFG